MKNALIIGAGPAGLTTALYGLEKDINVTIIEKDSPKNLPTKPCGEATPRKVLDYLPKDIGRDFVLNHIKRALMYFGGKFVREFRRADLVDGYIIDKHVFLLNMAEVAESRGAKIVWGKIVKPSKVDGYLRDYDFVIDASGKGVLARLFLNYKNYKVIPAFQAYAKGNDLQDDALILWGFDRGYAWIFPRGDKYNIGVGGDYKDINYLKNELRKLLEKFKLKIVTKLRGGSISIGGPIKKLINRKIRVVGEAAGAVMPTTGEGIRFAIESGTIVFEEDYEKKFWKQIGWKLKNGARLLRILFRIKDKYRLGKIASDETYYASSKEYTVSKI